MTALTITIANADVPDVLAAMEQRWKGVATDRSFSGDPSAYAAATLALRGQALLGAQLATITAAYRQQVAQQAIALGAVPAIT